MHYSCTLLEQGGRVKINITCGNRYLHLKDCFVSALKLLSDPENIPAMLNCAHGKDRTGVVCALVLGCLGRSKEYIAEEYAKSEV